MNNPNETLLEQIRRLNEQERVQHELRRQEALKRIRQLREELKYKEHKEKA